MGTKQINRTVTAIILLVGISRQLLHFVAYVLVLKQLPEINSIQDSRNHVEAC